MERKLVKQGRNALTVTLPAKWLKKRGLAQGDVVDITERNENLRVSTRLSESKRGIHIDVKGVESGLIWHIMQAKYIDGYDLIEVKHDNPTLIQKIANSCLGMIIESHTDTRTVIKSLIVVPEENFKAVFRRTGHMLVQLAHTLECVSLDRKTYHDFRKDEHLLNSHINYCLRYLNKYATSEGAYRYFLLCATIEEAGDILKAMAKSAKGHVRLVRKVAKLIESYDELLFKKELESLYHEIRRFRKSVKKDTFIDGLAFFLAEILYNYLGYLVED